MTTTPFNDNWTVRGESGAATEVTLPHDAMIGEPRSPAGATGSHGAYFPGGRYVYSTTWAAPADAAGRQFSLFFEGVYGETTVRVNGRDVGGSISGYREFAVRLDDAIEAGRDNLIEVEVDNSAVPNSRWYTGSGIYRRVWLEDVAPAHIQRDGLAIRTLHTDGVALVEVVVDVANPDAAPLRVAVSLEDADGNRISGEAEVENGRATLELEVPEPKLWSDRSPQLYTAGVELSAEGRVVDSRRVTTGLRTVEVDAEHGLRINGESVLLRGACVHHDSGILGAATFRASEYRRVRLLKASGFNAIRSSHNPLSRDMLDACDELGMYVLDELTDVWFAPKSAHDLAPRFDEIWRDDARSMVAKDRNHPSVIMYSIGNEIAESGSERGIAATRELSGFVRDLDPSRPTTIAVNFLLSVMASQGRSLFDTSPHDTEKAERKPSAATSTMANVVANRIGGIMQTVSKLPKADKVSRDTFGAVDVAGYNYAWGRYPGDAKRHPDRVVLGSESMPGDIPKIWPLVERLPNVIGDFIWTGWDYLGEAGLGSWAYGKGSAALAKGYPQLVAGCGLIDITGHPGGALLLARATWGLLDAPRIAVRPLDHAGEPVRRMAWRSTDAIESWSWAGCDGRVAEIEIYSSDERVEVFVNGRSLGRKAAGAKRGYVTRYRTRYEPGEIVAVGYRGGAEVGRSVLRSAGGARLAVTADKDALDADGQDLAFIAIELADEHGVVETMASDVVSVEVAGAAELAALGSGAPATTESFTDESHPTWYGRALAIVRSTGEGGPIVVSVSSRTHGTQTIELSAGEQTGAAVGSDGRDVPGDA